jgi:hypothetical protein
MIWSGLLGFLTCGLSRPSNIHITTTWTQYTSVHHTDNLYHIYTCFLTQFDQTNIGNQTFVAICELLRTVCEEWPHKSGKIMHSGCCLRFRTFCWCKCSRCVIAYNLHNLSPVSDCLTPTWSVMKHLTSRLCGFKIWLTHGTRMPHTLQNIWDTCYVCGNTVFTDKHGSVCGGTSAPRQTPTCCSPSSDGQNTRKISGSDIQLPAYVRIHILA